MNTNNDYPGAWRVQATRAALRPCAGIGLRSPHYREILATQPVLGWVEVHSENYFGAGGQALHYLEQISGLYALSLHGVGLSVGSAGPLSRTHLECLKLLVTRFNPSLISEHLSWGGCGRAALERPSSVALYR